jgi:mannose-6-phosphate isomerase-like protein (cupin superfamily)
MITIIDLKAESAGLAILKGRHPATTDAEKIGAMRKLAPYRDGAIYLSKFSGRNDWERHPQGDEIVQIVEGAATLHLISDEGRESRILAAGMVVIVPQNTWHQFEAPDGVSIMTATPQPTDHVGIDVDDPRTSGPFRERAESRLS